MAYTAEENDVAAVGDFTVFCDYIQSRKPAATGKGGLATRACCELNALLSRPKKDAKPTDWMDKYPSVSLWFHIAKESGIIVCEDEKRGVKPFFDATEAYAAFKDMNAFTRYILIFFTWLRFVDVKAATDRSAYAFILIADIVDDAFKVMAKHGPGVWHERGEHYVSLFRGTPVQSMMGECFKIIYNLTDLGLTEYVEGDEPHWREKYPVIERVKATRLGAALMSACATRRYSWFNVYLEPGVEMGEEELYERTCDTLESGRESFITPFLPLFPQGSVDAAAIDGVLFGETENIVYEFKVSLGKKCYRVIRCSPEHTFEALHMAIQKAFHFDDDHLYAFYIDGMRGSAYAVNSPHMEEPPFAHEKALGDVRLINKRRMLYLFDFGGQWKFDITVKIEAGSADGLKTPQIVKSVGASPEQYPDYE